MKNAVNMKVLVAVALLGTGLLLSGCKSAPELTQAKAKALIQAKYDQTPAVGVSITVDDLGLKQGLTAKYWKLTKVYPNNRWADYTLTDDGKKALKLLAGGEVIQWRPDQNTAAHFVVVTAVANHLRVKDVKDIQDEILPAVDTAKGAEFTEAVNMDGVPDALQAIAHNPGNKLSTKRQADFSLENGAWALHSIE